MSAEGKLRKSDAGAPQGGIFSPLLANIALTVLDKHFCDKWGSPDVSVGAVISGMGV